MIDFPDASTTFEYSFLKDHITRILLGGRGELDFCDVSSIDPANDILAISSLRKQIRSQLRRKNTSGQVTSAEDRRLVRSLSAEGFFGFTVDDNLPDQKLYYPATVRLSDAPGDYPSEYKSLSDLIATLHSRSRDEPGSDGFGVLLSSGSGSGKSVATRKAWYDCIIGEWELGEDGGVRRLKPLLEGHLPCWIRSFSASQAFDSGAAHSIAKAEGGDVARFLLLIAIESGVIASEDLTESPSIEFIRDVVSKIAFQLRYGFPLLIFLDLNHFPATMRGPLVASLRAFQNIYGSKHRCVVSYRSARDHEDDVISGLTRCGYQSGRFLTCELESLGKEASTNYLRAYRVREHAVFESFPDLSVPEIDIDIQCDQLIQLIERTERHGSGLITTPLIMHFASLLDGDALSRVDSYTHLYDEVVKSHVNREMLCGHRDRSVSRDDLIVAMTRTALIMQSQQDQYRIDRKRLVNALDSPKLDRRTSETWWPDDDYWVYDADDWFPYYSQRFSLTQSNEIFERGLFRADGEQICFVHDSFVDYFCGVTALQEYRKPGLPPRDSISDEWGTKLSQRLASTPLKWQEAAQFIGNSLNIELLTVVVKNLILSPPHVDLPRLILNLMKRAPRAIVREAVVTGILESNSFAVANPQSLLQQVYNHCQNIGLEETDKFAQELLADSRLSCEMRPPWFRAANRTSPGMQHDLDTADSCLLPRGRILFRRPNEDILYQKDPGQEPILVEPPIKTHAFTVVSNRYLAYLASPQLVEWRDLATGKVISSVNTYFDIHSLLTRDGGWLVGLGESGEIMLSDGFGKIIGGRVPNESPITDCVVVDENKFFVVCEEIVYQCTVDPNASEFNAVPIDRVKFVQDSGDQSVLCLINSLILAYPSRNAIVTLNTNSGELLEHSVSAGREITKLAACNSKLLVWTTNSEMHEGKILVVDPVKFRVDDAIELDIGPGRHLAAMSENKLLFVGNFCASLYSFDLLDYSVQRFPFPEDFWPRKIHIDSDGHVLMQSNYGYRRCADRAKLLSLSDAYTELKSKSVEGQYKYAARLKHVGKLDNATFFGASSQNIRIWNLAAEKEYFIESTDFIHEVVSIDSELVCLLSNGDLLVINTMSESAFLNPAVLPRNNASLIDTFHLVHVARGKSVVLAEELFLASSSPKRLLCVKLDGSNKLEWECKLPPESEKNFAATVDGKILFWNSNKLLFRSILEDQATTALFKEKVSQSKFLPSGDVVILTVDGSLYIWKPDSTDRSPELKHTGTDACSANLFVDSGFVHVCREGSRYERWDHQMQKREVFQNEVTSAYAFVHDKPILVSKGLVEAPSFSANWSVRMPYFGRNIDLDETLGIVILPGDLVPRVFAIEPFSEFSIDPNKSYDVVGLELKHIQRDSKSVDSKGWIQARIDCLNQESAFVECKDGRWLSQTADAVRNQLEALLPIQVLAVACRFARKVCRDESMWAEGVTEYREVGERLCDCLEAMCVDSGKLDLLREVSNVGRQALNDIAAARRIATKTLNLDLDLRLFRTQQILRLFSKVFFFAVEIERTGGLRPEKIKKFSRTRIVAKNVNLIDECVERLPEISKATVVSRDYFILD